MCLKFWLGKPQYPNYDTYAPDWLKVISCKFGEREKGDINTHLPTLYEICISTKAKRVVELGLWSGNSVFALIAGVMPFDGNVTSIDIDECQEAKRKISELELNNYWTFYQQDSIECGKNWEKSIDILFIDTTHEYQHVLNELNVWHGFIRGNGYICLHDIVHDGRSGDGGVAGAIHSFMKNHPKEYIYEAHYWNNGLGILRRI